MRTCIQCGQSCSFWRRDLFTGLCSSCRGTPRAAGLQNRKRRLRKLAMTLFIVAVSAICYCTPLLDVLFLDQPFSSERWLTGDARARGGWFATCSGPDCSKGKQTPKWKNCSEPQTSINTAAMTEFIESILAIAGYFNQSSMNSRLHAQPNTATLRQHTWTSGRSQFRSVLMVEADISEYISVVSLRRQSAALTHWRHSYRHGMIHLRERRSRVSASIQCHAGSRIPGKLRHSAWLARRSLRSS